VIQDQYWANGVGGYTEQPVFGVSIANGDGTFKPAVSYNYPPGGREGRRWPLAISMATGRLTLRRWPAITPLPFIWVEGMAPS
jgi:hypothetical protein